MLSWFFKKWKAPAAPVVAPVTPAAVQAQAQQAALAKAEARTRQDDTERAAWQPRLQAAIGDDAALLAVAQAAPGLDIKLAAVQAMAGEPTLRQAERAFRGHDRRVHRLAKQRLEAAVARRTTQARVLALTDSAAALVGQTDVPLNHLVALDRDWRALDATWIEAPQQAHFNALRERIDSGLREQSDQQQRGQRWLADAAVALADLRQACTQAAAGGDDNPGAGLASARAAAEALQLGCPAAPATAALNLSLASALQAAAAVQARLDLLAALAQALVAQAAVAVVAAVRVAPAGAAQAAALASDAPAVDALASDAPVSDATRGAPAHDVPVSASTSGAPAHDAPGSDTASGVLAHATVTTDAAAPVALSLAERWQALPALADAALAEPLALRFAQAQRALSPPLPAAAPARRQPDNRADARADARPARAPRLAPQAPNADQAAHLDGLLTRAEASAADGQLAALQQQLQAIDAVLAAPPGVTLNLPAADGLRGRYQALLDERSRLKDWQHWGGGRVREDLVAEAEALARITLAALPTAGPAVDAAPAPSPAAAAPAAAAAPTNAGTPAAPAEPVDPTAPTAPTTPPTPTTPTKPAEATTPPAEADAVAVTDAAGAAAPADPSAATAPAAPAAPAVAARPAGPAPGARPALSLNLKTHGDAIQALRSRWRELDRLGAAASPALWAAFDGALHQAYQPLAARQAAVKLARQDNLAAREALLDSLEALPGQPAGGAGDDAGAVWKAQLRALDRFQAAWRPLGPVEHTVPAAARDALLQRHRRAVERIEQPLQQARRAAAALREQLIERAESLVGTPDRGPAPDAPQQVRALQVDWQQHARTLPLARAAENALWSRFKAATDAVFQQRDAAFGARDAELGANLAARQALLQRLTDLGATAARTASMTDPTAQGDAPGAARPAASDIERTLAEVDRAWRQDAELPRGAAAGLDARYREARAAAQRQLADAGRARWQACCDGLAARWQLCEWREASASNTAADGVTPADLAQRWAALPAWPGACDDALARRWSAPLGASAAAAASGFDDTLLQLELALDLPAQPEQQAARQRLKLLALKSALEGRTATGATAFSPVPGLASALGQSGLDAAQRQRLQALLAALRQAPAGALGLAMPRRSADG